MAYARYFRNNIQLPRESSTTTSYATIDDAGNAVQGNASIPVLHNKSVADEFWDHYNGMRGSWSDRHDEIIAAHQSCFEGVLAPYVVPEDTERMTEAEVARKNHEYKAWGCSQWASGNLAIARVLLKRASPALQPKPPTDL